MSQKNDQFDFYNEETKEVLIRTAEDQRIQEAQWIEEELKRQRKIEDDLRLRLQEEQRLLDEKKKSISENMERTLQLRRYNEEKSAVIESEAYGLYGITGDKLAGIDHYKNAMFKGIAAGFFVLTLALSVMSGFMNGFDNNITLYLFGFMAAEGALIPRGKNKGIYRFICSIMYFTLLPAALFIFMSYELGYSEFNFVRPYIVMFAIIFAAFGTLGYFIYNPYSGDRKNIRLAKRDLKLIKIDAAKNVKRNEKDRAKFEEQQRKVMEKEAKEAKKQDEKDAKLAKKQDEKDAKEAKKQDEREAKEAKEAEALLKQKEEEARKQAEALEKKAKKEAEAQEKKAKKEAEKKAKLEAEKEKARIEAEAEMAKAEVEKAKAEAEKAKAEAEAEKAKAEVEMAKAEAEAEKVRKEADSEEAKESDDNASDEAKTEAEKTKKSRKRKSDEVKLHVI